MADTKLDIILRLKDEISSSLNKANTNLKDVENTANKSKSAFSGLGKTLDGLGSSLISAGHQVSRFGTNLAFVGAGATAPFIVALKSVEQFSYGVKTELAKTSNTYLQFSNTIAQAALPTLQEFNSTFAKLVNFFNAINPAILQNVAHWILVAGAVAIVTAVVAKLIGHFMMLTGQIFNVIKFFGWWNIAIIAIGAAVAGLIYAWTHFHDEFLKVLDGIEKVWLSVFDKMLLVWEKFSKALNLPTEKIRAQRADIQAELAKLATGHGALATGLDTTVNNVSAGLDKYVNAWKGASDQVETIMVDLKTRTQEFSMSVADGFAGAVDKVVFEGERMGDAVRKMMTSLARDLTSDFMKTGFKNLINKAFFPDKQQESGSGLGGYFASAILGSMQPVNKAATNTANTMNAASKSTAGLAQASQGASTGLGGFFGSLKGFSGAIAGLGNVLMAGMAGMGLGQAIGGDKGIAGQGGKWGMAGMLGGALLGGLLALPTGGLSMWAGAALGGFGGGFLGGLFHQGGMIYAHSGLAPDEVPIIAQSGEGVLSRRGMLALGGSNNLRKLNGGKSPDGGVTNSPVVVIQAWDTQDIMRNKKSIENIIVNALKRNSGIREAMKSCA